METAASRVPARRRYSATQFVDSNEQLYRELWSVLGMQWGNLLFDAAFASTIGSGNQKEFASNFSVTETQRRNILPLLHAMGWYDGMPLESGTYHYLLMQGMSLSGMVAMVGKVLDRRSRGDVTFGKMYALGGQRARSDKLDGTIEAIYGSLDQSVREHPWVVEQMKLMDSPDCMEPFKGAFATEFELFILAFLVAGDGSCHIYSEVEADDSESLDTGNVPARKIESCRLLLNDGGTVTVVNAPAERRARGEARSTSKNNVKHWLSTYGIVDGSTVVITASRNGTARVLATSEAMIHSINPTIDVIGFADVPEGEFEDHFVAMLSETANMVLKALEACLNKLLPTDAEPLTSRDVKLLLDRLRLDPTEMIASDIMDEVTLDLIPRA